MLGQGCEGAEGRLGKMMQGLTLRLERVKGFSHDAETLVLKLGSPLLDEADAPLLDCGMGVAVETDTGEGLGEGATG